jgi:LmbE family N-acetylglucosaminyl deacetylase
MPLLKLRLDATAPLRILCLGAHSDDIEIGCGGTLLRLAEEYPNSLVQTVVFSANGIRASEAERAAALFSSSPGPKGPLVIKGFRDGFLPFMGVEVKETFEELKAIAPDLIFTHNRKDAHQDHRLIAEMTWNTFRNHLILEYEVPKYDGDLGQPNFFVPLASGVCDTKVRYIMDAFQSQHSKQWFKPETFMAMMRLRGMECNAPSGYAEAFYCRKATL